MNVGKEIYTARQKEKNMIKKGLSELGFPSDGIDAAVEKLNLYADELELFNSAYDLVGADNHEDLLVRHILDSLAPYQKLKSMIEEYEAKGKSVSMADVGTGGGFPGIPLAIVFPKVHFTLIERMSKRCSFLENAVAVLKLENVEVKCLEAERVPQNLYDIVVFRAFKPLDKKIIRILLRMLHEDGKLAAYKARPEKIAEEMEGIKQMAPIWECVPLSVPFLPQNQRHLVIIPRKQFN